MSTVWLRPFDFRQNATQNVAVTGSNQSTAITGAGVGTQTIRLVNIGSQTVFFSLTDAAGTAAVASSTPLLPNSVETFLLRKENTYINAIAAGTGSTLYWTLGESA